MRIKSCSINIQNDALRKDHNEYALILIETIILIDVHQCKWNELVTTYLTMKSINRLKCSVFWLMKLVSRENPINTDSVEICVAIN